MARRKEDPPKGSPAWMNTFADLMNLLLCFFVMLFSMSSVNEEKFEKVIASFQSTFSILPGGGASIGEGELISSGISQLENFDSYYNQQLSSQSDGQTEEEKDITEAYEQQELEESEDMAQQLENALSQYGIQDDVEVDFNAEYVTLNMNGALLFEAGTGVGKSMAYLVPGIIAARRFKRQLVVATHTIALQQQIMQKDLPQKRQGFLSITPSKSDASNTRVDIYES